MKLLDSRSCHATTISSCHSSTPTHRSTPAFFRSLSHHNSSSSSHSSSSNLMMTKTKKRHGPLSLPTSARASPPPPSPRSRPPSPRNATTTGRVPPPLKRTMSLPTKLDQAPRTKKLFWFRPDLLDRSSFVGRGEEEKEDTPRRCLLTRRMSTMEEKQQQRHDETREFLARPCHAHLLASLGNDSSTLESSDNDDFVEDLIGLEILADE